MADPVARRRYGRYGCRHRGCGYVVDETGRDVLFLSLSDMAYREGSLYHAMTQRQTFLISMSIVITCILLLGMLRRERKEVGNIGFESALVPIVYAASIAMLTIW